MTRKMYGFSDEGFLHLLERILAKHSPERLTLLEQARACRLSEAEREILRAALADELVSEELDSSSEPSARGRLLEAAIDWLASR